MIQHRAARFVLNKPWFRSSEQQHDSVTDMLTYLEWPSLQDRRTMTRLTLLFKILRRLIVIPDRCIPPSVPVSYTCSNHPLKLFHLPTRIDVYKYSFLPRTIIQWNQLPISDIDKIDIDTFNSYILLITQLNTYSN